jgi:hypothetical protein
MASGRDFKNEMRKKLMAMNSEFADSDMLIDFVVVMLENKKAKEYVFEQLLDCELIATCSTQTFQ